jgi:VEFS-Box of polycomb protein
LNIRFADTAQLMEHLRACHGRFRYVLDSANSDNADIIVVEVRTDCFHFLFMSPMCGVLLTLPPSLCSTIILSARTKMKLLAGSAGVFATRVDKLKAWDTEAVYVNPKRYPSYCTDVCEVSGLGVWKTTLFVTRLNADGRARPRDVTQGDASVSTKHVAGKESQQVELSELYDVNRKRLLTTVQANRNMSLEVLNGFVTCFRPGPTTESAGGFNLRARTANSGGAGLQYGSVRDEEGVTKCSVEIDENDCMDAHSLDHLTIENVDGDRANGSDGSISLENPRTAERKGGGRKSGTKPNGLADWAVQTFKAGVHRGNLFSSVLQTTPNVLDFEDGADSDAEKVIDEDWRLEVGDRLLSEFVDTSPQEKVYMSLWNQYVLREVYAYSDRTQLDVMFSFAQRYGAVVFALNLNVIFVRHLGELHRRGLIDATGIHETVVELGQARVAAIADPGIVEERLSQFAFYNRVFSEVGERNET